MNYWRCLIVYGLWNGISQVRGAVGMHVRRRACKQAS